MESTRRKWAYFRLNVVGQLYASPPARGELRNRLKALAARTWKHPLTLEPLLLAFSTVERWYYKASGRAKNPIEALQTKVRRDNGLLRSIDKCLSDLLLEQYRAHPGWSYQLHYDNLVIELKKETAEAALPSYSSVRRFMRQNGLIKKRVSRKQRTTAMIEADERFESREVRSYEVEYVNGLWHLDFHSGSLRVLHSTGEWVYPKLMAIIDDYSRLCVHLQWYIHETSENLVHALSQAIEKYGLPRSLMSDNGAAMLASETTEGLQRLSIVHRPTLAYSPYQNGKIESFWGQIEGRLLAMLEGCNELTLAKLNEATLAWCDFEYNRKKHSETSVAPLTRFAHDKSVGRPSPDSATLRLAFTRIIHRRQRHGDGTISLFNRRFEVPSQYRHLPMIAVRVATWDLTHVYMCNSQNDEIIRRLYPQDKLKNADARRRCKPSLMEGEATHLSAHSGKPAPLLQHYIDEYRADGLPPAYIPKHEEINPPKETSHE